MMIYFSNIDTDMETNIDIEIDIDKDVDIDTEKHTKKLGKPDLLFPHGYKSAISLTLQT